jgi:hypothetical protein
MLTCRPLSATDVAQSRALVVVLGPTDLPKNTT